MRIHHGSQKLREISAQSAGIISDKRSSHQIGVDQAYDCTKILFADLFIIKHTEHFQKERRRHS